jgi:hypothetical protein
LDQWLPSTKTTSLSLFLWKLEAEHEYTPFGEQILTYELKEENRTPYLIHRVNQHFCDDKKFLEWYCRLETFLVFFINNASIINKTDPNWIIYLLYQQYKNDNGQICYAPIGFTKVYLYHALPDKKRPRIRLDYFFFCLKIFFIF